jgi:hypothetical protein
MQGGMHDERKQVLVRMIGFISTWLQVFLITLKYSAVADLHNFQFTVAHALGLFVSTSDHLAADLNT